MEPTVLKKFWSALLGTNTSDGKSRSQHSLASRCSILLVLASAYILTIDQGKYRQVRVLILIIRSIYWTAGAAIKCWVCRSDGDPKCADPFDNTSFPITDCAQEKPRDHLPGLEATMCRKVRQKGIQLWSLWTSFVFLSARQTDQHQTHIPCPSCDLSYK